MLAAFDARRAFLFCLAKSATADGTRLSSRKVSRSLPAERSETNESLWPATLAVQLGAGGSALGRVPETSPHAHSADLNACALADVHPHAHSHPQSHANLHTDGHCHAHLYTHADAHGPATRCDGAALGAHLQWRCL